VQVDSLDSKSDPLLVIITGGQGGLAAALRERFTEAGADVLAPGRNQLDVRCGESVGAFFSQQPRVDVLINNAGLTRDELLLRQSPEDFDEVIRVNLRGAHLCSQAVARHMIRQRSGHIVNIGSYSAVVPPPGQVAYASAKAGLIGLTKSYARELGSRNVRVNCVLPGFLETKMTAGLSEAARAAALARHAIGRFNTVTEAARFVQFLTTTEAVSGQVFQLDSRV
jgi:3-oxoacyl-[acyl-carrier protein] reductase